MAPVTSSAVAAPTRALLRRFRSQRPLRGGSLLVTIFGDAIAPRGGAVSLRTLIDLAAPFGLTERLVRTSVGRLAQEGWLVARREGRLSEYRLTAEGAQRFAEATERIYGQVPLSWDGFWSLLLLPSNVASASGRSALAAAPRRDALREELRWLGFGQISPGVFAHPNGDVHQVGAWLSPLQLAPGRLLLRASSDSLEINTRVVACGWDLAELGKRYARFIQSFDEVQLALPNDTPLSGEESFVIRTLLIHEYRRIHLRDPLLPAALLPSDWVGTSAYELTSRLYARVLAASEAHLSRTAATLDAALPAPTAALKARFGAAAQSA